MPDDIFDFNDEVVDRGFYMSTSGRMCYKVIRLSEEDGLRYFECKPDGSNQTFDIRELPPMVTEEEAMNFIRIENPRAVRTFLGGHEFYSD